MYAIVKTGGKQYKVAEGDVIEVEKLAGGARSTQTDSTDVERQVELGIVDRSL